MHHFQQSVWGSMTPPATATNTMSSGPGTISPPTATLLGSCTPLTLPLTQSAATMATPMLPNPPQQQSPFLANDATTQLQFLHYPNQGLPPILSGEWSGRNYYSIWMNGWIIVECCVGSSSLADVSMSMQNLFQTINGASLSASPSSPNQLAAHGKYRQSLLFYGSYWLR